MKIEFDFARPEELRKLKREYETALAIIDAALAAIGRDKVEHPEQMPLPTIPKTTSGQSANPAIASVIAKCEQEFDQKNFLQLAKADGIPEQKARREIRNMVASGLLKLVTQGKGRCPSIFRKQ